MTFQVSLAAASLLVWALASAHAQTIPLNDTGITVSGAAAGGNAINCQMDHPKRQDCRYGRDAASALIKTGSGEAGFDYTKISGSGSPLPANAVLGSGPGDWACTRDNVSGLLWEVKTAVGPRSADHTYTWNTTQNPFDTCGGTLANCTADSYVAAVNAMGLCGRTNWRVPLLDELQGIIHMGRSNPAIDPAYFPNTPASELTFYWSASRLTGGPNSAWGAWFDDGNLSTSDTTYDNHVRLVSTPF